MAQNYLPAIKDGDKRVPVVDGEPVPYCLARIPQGGETRGNLGRWRSWRAASFDRQRLGNCTSHWANAESERFDFVGLDIIGDRLTEINVTSPTCIREIEAGVPGFDYRYADGCH